MHYYPLKTHSLSTSNNTRFPWKLVWHSKVPPRVAIFSWAASLGKILSTNNLWKSGIIVLDWCCMCKRCGESVDHLLLHCPIDYELWTMVFCLFGLQWVMPKRVIDLFTAWQRFFGRHRNIAFWKAVPHCIVWCIWWEQNARSFEGCEPSILDVKAFFFRTLLDWNVAFYPSLCFSLLDLVEHCTLRAVWNSPRVHPPVYLVLFLLIKFLLFNQKQKTICTLQCLSHLDITNWGIYGEKNG